MTEVTYYGWRQEIGGLKMDQVREWHHAKTPGATACGRIGSPSGEGSMIRANLPEAWRPSAQENAVPRPHDEQFPRLMEAGASHSMFSGGYPSSAFC